MCQVLVEKWGNVWYLLLFTKKSNEKNSEKILNNMKEIKVSKLALSIKIMTIIFFSGNYK